MIHTVKGFSIVNEAEVNIFLEFYFLCDPMDVAILISGSSAFSKSSLKGIQILKIIVYLVLSGHWERENIISKDVNGQRRQECIYNGLKTISLTSGAGNSGQPLVKEWN